MEILSACPGMNFYSYNSLKYRLIFLRIPFEGNTIDKEVEILQVAMGIAPDTQGKLIASLSRITYDL